jgi:hypothetical protein
MKRRHFIGLAAAGAAGLALPAAATRPIDGICALGYPNLDHVLRDPGAIRALGQRYRELVPAENDAKTLEEIFRKELPLDLSAPATSELDAQVSALVRRDFDSGRTIVVNGWVLSVTEARQCALHSLTAG